MTGKARSRKSLANTIGRSKEDINRLFNVKTRNKIVTPTQVTLPAGSTNIGNTSGFLSLNGGIMNGPIGGRAFAKAISSGDLNITTDNAGNAIKELPIIFVSPESGTTDVLDTITISNSFPMGGRILLIGASGNTISITHNSGSGSGLKKKIIFDSASGQSLTDTRAIEFYYDIVSDAFHSIGIGKPFEIGAGNNYITVSTSNILHSVETSDYHEFQVNSTLIMRVEETQIDVRKKLVNGGVNVDIGEDGSPFTNVYSKDMEIQDTANNVPSLTFYRDDSTPGDFDVVGQINFYGEDSASAKTKYATISALADDVTNGTEDGGITFNVFSGGSDVTVLYISGASTNFQFQGGWALKSDTTTEIGFQVTNASLTVGSLGSMEAPVLTQDATPSDATLDGFFGDTNGCFGFWRDSDSDANSRGFVRMNGVWYYWFLANL